LVGDGLATGVATIGVTSTDSIGSVYRMGFVPSGARIEAIYYVADPLGGISPIFQLGVYCNDQASLNLTNSINPWSALVTYAPGNVVQYNGFVYTCILANTNQLPTNLAFWNVGGSTVAAPGTVPLPNAHFILCSAVVGSPSTTWEALYQPTVLGAPFQAINMTLRIWELLNLTADPFYNFVIALTCTAAPSVAGNIVLRWDSVR
jgi:hypothetical protein